VGAFHEIANVEHCNSLKLVSVVPTKFVSTIVIQKRFRSLNKGFQRMVISDGC